eukprot:248930-Rhodomonas_salina.1
MQRSSLGALRAVGCSANHNFHFCSRPQSCPYLEDWAHGFEIHAEYLCIPINGELISGTFTIAWQAFDFIKERSVPIRGARVLI